MGQSRPPAVLVVDDEPLVRNLVADVLRDEGYRVLEARNGRDAVRVVNQQLEPSEYPCLVLLDLMLPEMDGLRVLQQLAAPGGRVPVIAMSASQQHLDAARLEGADAVLQK